MLREGFILNVSFPASIYMFKVNIRKALEKGMKFARS